MKKTTALSAKLPIGNLDSKVTFRAVTETQDAFGQPVKTWSDVYTDYAAIEYGGGMNGGGTEAQEAARRTSTVDIAFYVRSHTQSQAITPKHRIVFDGGDYDITGITEPMGRGRFIKFTCIIRD